MKQCNRFTMYSDTKQNYGFTMFNNSSVIGTVNRVQFTVMYTVFSLPKLLQCAVYRIQLYVNCVVNINKVLSVRR